MANANLTLNVKDHWDDGKRIHVIGNITNDGGNYAAGGLTLSLAAGVIKGSYVLHAYAFAKNALYFITDANGNFPEDEDANGVGGALESSMLLWAYSVPGTQLGTTALPDSKVKIYAIYSKLI
jgi:hypothetical protein